jgi:hypothetical protein
MDNLYNKIVSQRGSFEKLAMKLPGYTGYKNMSDRRSADRMMREHIVSLLRQQLNQLVEAEKKILKSGGLAMADATAESKRKLQILIDKLNAAMPGYAGFFDAQKVGEAELEKIYNFDAAILSYTDKFREAIDAVDKAAADKATLTDAISALESLANEANEAYSLRDNVLREIA